MSRRRPWRAVAYLSDWTEPTGSRTVGRVAACTRAGLDAWVRERRAAGQSVRTWQVLALAEAPATPAPPRQAQPVA